MASKMITYAQAINEATAKAMKDDPSIFVYGIGVPDHKHVFGTTEAASAIFPSRVLDTPLSEAALTGFGIGSAIRGLHPLQIHIRSDFMLLSISQLVNMASTHHYLTGDPVPFTIRAIVGRGWGQGCHHSKSLYNLFSGIPGIEIYAPSRPADAGKMLLHALREPNPTIIFEHRWLYWAEGEVDEDSILLPTNPVIRRGSDITIASVSWMTVEAMRAAEVMSGRGVEAEIVDLRYIHPLPLLDLVHSVSKTRHLIVAENDYTFGGISSEIAARLAENELLPKKFGRIGFSPSPIPTARHLEDQLYPSAASIIREIEFQLDLDTMDLDGVFDYSHENKFRGPF